MMVMVADPRAEPLGELLADRDPRARVELVERALNDVAGHARQALEVGLADAAHERAARTELRARERLTFDQRQRQRHAGDLAHPVGHRLVVGQRRIDPLQEHVAVEADHLLHEVVAKAVHHRHDDDERGDAEHDAEKREAGDHRDRLLRVAGAQIAERDQPFERRERARGARRRRSGLCGGRGHGAPPHPSGFAGCLLPEGEGNAPLLPQGEGGAKRRMRDRRPHAVPPSFEIAASTLSISRSPVRRSFSSTLPSARLLGPTIT